MLTAYLTIFQEIPYVVAILVGLSILSLTFQKDSLIMRSILFSFGFWLAPLFYIMYIVLVHRSPLEIVAALFVESVIFGVYQALFVGMFRLVNDKRLLKINQLTSLLKIGTAVVAISAAQLFFVGNVGIFSESGRNEYLADSRWLIYSTYASSLVEAVMIPVVAAIINHTHRWTKLIIFYLVFISGLSIIRGSKGGGVMSIVAILSLIKFQRAREYVRLLKVPLAVTIAGFSATVYYLGKFLSLEPFQMVSLIFARIFINNDARALAIDLGGLQNLSLFRESFRSLATLLGVPPINPALGQYLYAQAFHASGFVGANSSSTALLIAYGDPAEKIIFSVFLSSVAIMIYLFTRVQDKYSLVRLAVALSLLSQLSQDFLAFQLVVNILVLSLFLILTIVLIHRLLAIASAQKFAQ